MLLLSILTISCNQLSNEEVDKKTDKKLVKEHLERANKYLVKAEEQNIRDYIHRYNYNMTETGSGLFYEIYKKTKGEQASNGKIAKLNFKIFLLNGTLIYSSDNEGLKEFLIGKGGVESGLEEGILLMKKGEKARFVIPSHLAFGLLGDLNKVPEKATIVYDVELVELITKSKKQK
jgi:FKBP-type peptidyl-prolyl cis-trans isomerase